MIGMPMFILVCFLIAFSFGTETPSNSFTRKWWTVKSLPKRQFRASQHLLLKEEEHFNVNQIELEDNQALVQVEAFSVDAFLRTLLDPDSFHLSLNVGDTMRASGYGKVIRVGSSEKAAYEVGSRVVGILPASNLAVVTKSHFLMPTNSFLKVPTSLYLDLLGNSGLSAYVALFRVTQPPRKGETVVVSAAAGGVGTCAVQMAKICGARVVGIAGGPEKRDFLLNEVGVDAVIDYKDASRSLQDQLLEACPDGIDFFLDNVGGSILDAVLEKINVNARIVICGAISQYDTGHLYTKPQGPSQYLKLAEKSASMSGFVLGHYFKSPLKMLAAIRFILWHWWMGNLKSFLQVEEGIESFGPALEKLLNGKNTGRLVVDVSGELET